MINGLNITLPIWQDNGNSVVSFYNLELKKPVVDGVVMSLSDKITGDVYCKDSNLVFTMKEFVTYNDVNYYLVNPPTVVREGMVKDNGDLKGMTKYSLEFYHPMYMLSNFPFSDVAVSYDEMRFKSQDKSFGWIGKPADFVAKLNKNLEGTEWVVVLSDRFPQDKENVLSEVLSFDNNTIADALKTGYETWNVPYVVDKLHQGEYSYTTAQYPNGRDYYLDGKRFVVLFGLPSNEIYEHDGDTDPYVFKFGQGVGLKNNSRNPRNNKIVTRIAGYGSERNIPYGYPQIRWYGDPDATCTIGDSVGAKQNVEINGTTYATAMSYPIYEGIVGGEYVKLIKHPFTRKHLMPSVYAKSVFNKVSQYTTNEQGDVIPNPNYDPNLEIIDYYDAVENQDGYGYANLINPSAPSYEIHEFDDVYPELGEEQILGATPVNSQLEDVTDWDDTIDDDGNYLQSYFRITLPQLSFDIYACAAITQEMQINMRSGACIGCTFTVQVDWEDYKMNFYDSDLNFVPHGTQRNYDRYPDSSQGSISVIVQKDINTFGTLMPNIYQKPAANDAFVILGISLPLTYITSAQERLDDAMKSYMFENNIYYFDYPLKFDERFLRQNQYILNQIRPNSIIRFEYNGLGMELFVKQLTIKYGESILPQYDITLTDNIDVVLNAIGQVADDVQHIGSLVALLRQSYNKSVWAEMLKKLSKVDDDTANGLITFLKGLRTGQFRSGWLGSGANIDARGNSEFESVYVRGALRAAELVFNRISAEEGEAIRSIGHGEILTVDEENFTATLKLEGDEWPTIEVGDICRGLYNTIAKDYDNAESEGQDDNGFRNKQGFFASYFKVEEIISSGKGECEFRYSLQTDDEDNIITEHPCPLMKFAVYGNTDNTKSERQSSMYITAVGIAPRLLFLARVNDWQIKPENIKVALGNIDGLQVGELINGEYSLKTLAGDAGIFVEDNIYLGGIINQFTAADWEYIQNKLGQGIHAQLVMGSDNIIIDALGNVVGGLYVESTDGTTVTRQYKLHTGVLVYDSGKKKYLTVGNPSNLGDDEFAMYVTANGCTVLQDGSDVYVTAIDNTANGETLTDEQLETMRDTNEFSVDFVVVTKNGWRTQMSYPVKITHLDQSYITFDLTNEMDSMSYSEQLGQYIGIPISTTLKAYVNGIELPNDAYVKTIVTSDAFTGTIVSQNAQAPVVKFFGDDAANGLRCTVSKYGSLVINSTGNNSVDMQDDKYTFDIQCVIKYAGASYTSAVKRFTLTEITNATLYKLLLSANAISKDGSTYTPSSVDVKVQITNNDGNNVYTESQLEQSGNIKVRYINGVYDASLTQQWLTPSNKPSFDQVQTCMTVLVVDMTDVNNPIVLDIESVTINAVGRDGAGQPWIKCNLDQIVIDCDSDGKIKNQLPPFALRWELYWGDHKCTLSSSEGDCIAMLGNTEIQKTLGSTYMTASLTFNQGDVLDTTSLGAALVGYDGNGDEHSATLTIPVISNRQGAVGKSGASIRFRKVYSPEVDASGEGYVWDDTFRDCVKYGSSYYLVNVPSDGSEALGNPDNNDKWYNVGSLNFVATELLLAENAVIDLLFSNIIKMRDSVGNITATINEDEHGSYCIYYLGGNKRMEFRYDGFIVYYNDDETNSVAWKLGHGGDITKSSSDDWQLFPLHRLTATELRNITSSSRFELSNYWKFVSGSVGQWSSYNGKIFTQKPSNNNPATAEENNWLISNGEYTPNYMPYENNPSMDGSSPAITVYTISGGVITDTRESDEPLSNG